MFRSISKVLSIVLTITFLASQVVPAFAQENLSPALVSNDMLPERGDDVKQEAAEKSEPGAIGNGQPLVDLLKGEEGLPGRIDLSENPDAVLIAERIGNAVQEAIDLHIEARDNNLIPSDLTERAKFTLDNLLTLQQYSSDKLYLFKEIINGIEEYLLGFHFDKTRKIENAGIALGLVQKLSAKRLAQYIYHESVREHLTLDTGTNQIDRQDHRDIYKRLQTAVFGAEEVEGLRSDLREFILDNVTLSEEDYMQMADKAMDDCGQKEEITITAKKNLKAWMTEEKYSDYHAVLRKLVVLAQIDTKIRDELFDSFYMVVKFGTGGRRGKVGVGPNRINPYMTALSTQGHSEYIKKKLIIDLQAGKEGLTEEEAEKKAAEIMKRRGVVAAYDVREFTKYFPEIASMTRYREAISDKCPVLVGFTSKKMSEIDGAVYAANGIRYYMPSEVRSTPWLSFATAHIHGILDDIDDGEYRDERALGGTVKSSSHNLPDNNGDKFYEQDGGQAPPEESQLMKEAGTEAEKIKYYPGGIEQARKDGLFVDLTGEELEAVDKAYEEAVRAEVEGFTTREKIEGTEIAFNALNGTGDTNLLPILEEEGYIVKRSPGDVHDSTFPEADENRPNPEVEESFDKVIVIAIREDKERFEAMGMTPVIGSDNRSMSFDVPETVDLDIVKEAVLKLQVAYITDPDSDRLGLAVKKLDIDEKNRTVNIKWVTANDNDESGIILFRYLIEKKLEKLSKDKVYVLVTTVVSNELEEQIVKDLALKYGLNIVSLRHPVGFKFTGEVMTNIKDNKPSGIVGRMMENIPVNLNGQLGEFNNLAEAVLKGKAEFIMSFEEGEGGVIGYKGSVDKDSGIVGLTVAHLASEMRSQGRTVYDYLQGTYRNFGYGKSYLEPIVLDGTKGQETIARLVETFKTDPPEVLKLINGHEIKVIDVMNYLEKYPTTTETEVEALNLILLTLDTVELADGSKVKGARVLIRASGTEPKIKIWVMIPSESSDGLSREAFERRIDLVNQLNRDVLDAMLLEAYDLTKYPGIPEDISGRLQLLRLDFNVALSRKLENYFPMVGKIEEKAMEIMAKKADLATQMKYFTDTSQNEDLKALQSAGLVKKSFIINLGYQVKELSEEPTKEELLMIAVQAVLLFGEEEGLSVYQAALNESDREDVKAFSESANIPDMIQLMLKQEDVQEEVEEEFSLDEVKGQLSYRAELFRQNVYNVLERAEKTDTSVVLAFDSDLGKDTQHSEIMELWTVVEQIRDLKKPGTSQPLFPNLIVIRGSGTKGTLMKEFQDTSQGRNITMDNVFIVTRQANIENNIFEDLSGAWKTGIDDENCERFEYLPVFEAATLTMMASLGVDLSYIKKYYNSISFTEMTDEQIEFMIEAKKFYILPKMTRYDRDGLRKVYEGMRDIVFSA